MTTLEAIQMNIHDVKTQLNKSRSVIPADELQKLHIDCNIEALLEELNDLKFSLDCEIKKLSK
jgi:hypothetical protein